MEFLIKKALFLSVVFAFASSLVAMDDAISFRFDGTGLCLEVPHNLNDLKEGDQVQIRYDGSDIEHFRKDEELKRLIKIESSKIKESIPEKYDINSYDNVSWNMHLLSLYNCSRKNFYEIPSWKVVEMNMKRGASGNFFSLLFLLREKDFTFLPFIMNYWIEVGRGHWNNDHLLFHYQITRIEAYQMQKYECC